MILHLLRALRRLVSRRARPVEQGVPVVVSLSVAAWHGPLPAAGTVCWYDPDTGTWSACEAPTGEVALPEPTPLDAIAARFDAAVDEAARGRNVPPRA